MSGLRCPSCNGRTTVRGQKSNRRRRECSSCGHSFTTWEIATPPAELAVKVACEPPPHRPGWGRPRGERRTTNPLTCAVLDAIERSGLDDKWIAAKAGLPKGTISNWRLDRTTPNGNQIAWVLTVLGATFSIHDGATP